MRTLIVGAGSSGGVVAARLAEDDREEVVLLEAGPDYASPEALPDGLRDPYNPDLTSHDWGFRAYALEPPSARAPINYPRGRVVGGSSAVNACAASRGDARDYAAWAAAGNDEWGWEQVLPAFNRLEADLDFGSEPHHGTDGPVPIFRWGRERWSAAGRAFEQGCLDRGFASCDDLNAPDATGVGPAPRNQVGDYRASVTNTYLQAVRKNPNLEIRSNTTVRRIVFDGERAIGVEVGDSTVIEADRVVLSTGAIKSPQLLTLSGVGPADVLRRLGISPVAALNGVGKRLYDHPSAPVVGLLEEEPTPQYGFRVRFLWGEEGRNLFMCAPSTMRVTSLNFQLDTDATTALFAPVTLAMPLSHGWIEITSADPEVDPEIHLNFLDDELDVRRLSEAVRLIVSILSSSPVSSEVTEVLQPRVDVLADDEKLARWLRASCNTAFHPAGTCAMGPASDPDAVVDQRLAVHGIAGLYVADASVMPTLPFGLTNLACYMVGERAADFLKEAVR